MDLSTLNEVQKKAVSDTEGAVLVFAVAGSGKTKILTYRIANIIEKGLAAPDRILALTFTNKAANEMKERIKNLIGYSGGIWISTFHSLCTNILRSNIEKIPGYTRNFTIYDESDTNQIYKKIFAELDIDDENIKKSVKYHISNAKNLYKSPEEYNNLILGESFADLIYDTYIKYNSALKSANALDFDDLLFMTCELFKKFPEIKEYYQNKYKYIHVDEYQDTNKIQYLLIRILADKHKNIFVVGDDDQGIYSWRGADIRNILDFEKDFGDAKVYFLEQNYRSSKKIIEAANTIIQKNTSRKKKASWTDNGEGAPIEKYSGYNEREECEYVVSSINNLISHYNYKYSDFAILMRINALSRRFEERLRSYGLPYKVYGGMSFYKRKEIKDIIAYLNFLINKNDEVSLLRIINVPKRSIGEASINSMRNYCIQNNISFTDFILNIENYPKILGSAAEKKVRDFSNLINNLSNNISEYKISDFINYCIKETGILSMYDRQNEEDAARLMNIDEFINSAKEYEELNNSNDLSEFLQSIALVNDMDENEESNDNIIISTVHSVKGLEFKVVYIVGVEENIFPLGRAKNSPEEEEEERRLMYVAITRARERLYFTRSENRYLYGKNQMSMESTFWRDLFKKDRPAINKLADESYYVDSYENATKSFDYAKNYFNSPVKKNDNNLNYNIYKTGTIVKHKTFGKGVIAAISGDNDKMVLTIAFEKPIGIKMLSAKIAPLEIIKN